MNLHNLQYIYIYIYIYIYRTQTASVGRGLVPPASPSRPRASQSAALLAAADVFVGSFEMGGSSVDGLFELRVHSPKTGQATWMTEGLGPHPGWMTSCHAAGLDACAGGSLETPVFGYLNYTGFGSCSGGACRCVCVCVCVVCVCVCVCVVCVCVVCVCCVCVCVCVLCVCVCVCVYAYICIYVCM